MPFVNDHSIPNKLINPPITPLKYRCFYSYPTDEETEAQRPLINKWKSKTSNAVYKSHVLSHRHFRCYSGLIKRDFHHHGSTLNDLFGATDNTRIHIYQTLSGNPDLE